MSAHDPKPERSGDKPAEPAERTDASKGGESSPDKKTGEEAKKDAKPKGPPWYKRPLLVGLLVLVAIVLVVGGALFWAASRGTTPQPTTPTSTAHPNRRPPRSPAG